MTSSTATVFDTTPAAPVPPPVVTPPVAPANTPTVEALVGDGKKFKTVEDLAKSKLESDNFINQLTEEMKELRKDLNTRVRAEEAIEALREGRKDNTPPKGNEPPVDFKQIARETFDEVESEKIAIGNIRSANDYLVTKLGSSDEAKKFLQLKSIELGIPVDWFMDMAAKSPKALYNTLGVDAPVAEPPKGTMQSDANTLAKKIHNPGPKAGSKAEFDKLRKESPDEYWKPATQQAIFEAKKKGQYE